MMLFFFLIKNFFTMITYTYKTTFHLIFNYYYMLVTNMFLCIKSKDCFLIFYYQAITCLFPLKIDSYLDWQEILKPFVVKQINYDVYAIWIKQFFRNDGKKLFQFSKLHVVLIHFYKKYLHFHNSDTQHK